MNARLSRALHALAAIAAMALLPLPFAHAAGTASRAGAATPLDLQAYGGDSGAITILHGGAASDPYFTLQALLLAHDNGLDIQGPAVRFADWLVPQQKPDGTFDRFCRDDGGGWKACKTADADDSLLAMWLRLLQAMPAHVKASPALRKSQATSRAALAHLYQPSRGIYMVSPVYLHGLFMDNLEVWSLRVREPLSAPGAEPSERLAQAIHDTFWDPVNRRFLVSTQMEQRAQPAAFYPDHVAQLFPLMEGFPLLPDSADAHYRDWMRRHRSEWLAQGQTDYPWGIIAVLALRRNDPDTARCWVRHSAPLRHSARWAVTDEVSFQILASKGVDAAPPAAACR